MTRGLSKWIDEGVRVQTCTRLAACISYLDPDKCVSAAPRVQP